MRKAFVAAALIQGLGLLGSTGCVFAADAPTAPDLLDRQREWVREVERGDYFFWERFFYRKDNPGEFPLPPEWYRPDELVLGEPGAPLVVRPASQRRLSAATIEKLEAYLRPRETGAFYVMHAGQIDYQSFGPGTHPGSLLAVRSMTKSLAGLLTGIAIERGAIHGLDDPASRYLPEWAGDARGTITLRQLLTMSSGLENVPLRVEPGNKNLLLAEGSDVNATALSYAKAREPDQQWSLNQADTQLVGLILERATKQRFGEFLSDALWRPLGLDTATLNLDGKRGNARTYCCMRARGGDWLKIGYTMMHDGAWQGRQVLPKGWMKTMLAPSRANPYAGLHVLRGWGPGEPRPTLPFPRYTEPFRVPGVFFIFGGQSIMLWMVPSLDLVILRWGNDPPDWDPTLVPNLVIDDFRARRTRG